MAENIATKHSGNLIPTNTVALQLRPLLKILQIVRGYPIVATVTNTDKKSHGNNKTNFVFKEENLFLAAPVNEKFNINGDVFSIKFDKNPNNNLQSEKRRVTYENTSFKWNKACFWYSLALKSIIFLGLVTFVLNMALDIPQPVNLFRYAPSFVQSASLKSLQYHNAGTIMEAALRILEIIVLHLNADQQVCWLNNWNLFEAEFFNCFEKGHGMGMGMFNFDVRKYRNSIIFFLFILPSSYWVTLFLFFVPPIFELHEPYWGRLFIFIASNTLWGSPLLEDCKVLLLLKTSVLAYEQIRIGIQNGYAAEKNVKCSDVIGWRNLINASRHQTALVSSYLKSQHIIMVVETIIVCTLGTSFVLILLKDGGLTTQVMPLLATTFYSVYSILRLYLKVGRAEKITNEELLIANFLMEIEEKCTNGACKTELKFLYNMLTQNTVVINFGNYFSLNRKLLLQVGAQVVTYLIVILQFEGNSRSDTAVTTVTFNRTI